MRTCITVNTASGTGKDAGLVAQISCVDLTNMALLCAVAAGFANDHAGIRLAYQACVSVSGLSAVAAGVPVLFCDRSILVGDLGPEGCDCFGGFVSRDFP